MKTFFKIFIAVIIVGIFGYTIVFLYGKSKEQQGKLLPKSNSKEKPSTYSSTQPLKESSSTGDRTYQKAPQV